MCQNTLLHKKFFLYHPVVKNERPNAPVIVEVCRYKSKYEHFTWLEKNNYVINLTFLGDKIDLDVQSFCHVLKQVSDEKLKIPSNIYFRYLNQKKPISVSFVGSDQKESFLSKLKDSKSHAIKFKKSKVNHTYFEKNENLSTEDKIVGQWQFIPICYPVIDSGPEGICHIDDFPLKSVQRTTCTITSFYAGNSKKIPEKRFMHIKLTLSNNTGSVHENFWKYYRKVYKSGLLSENNNVVSRKTPALPLHEKLLKKNTNGETDKELNLKEAFAKNTQALKIMSNSLGENTIYSNYMRQLNYLLHQVSTKLHNEKHKLTKDDVEVLYENALKMLPRKDYTLLCPIDLKLPSKK